MLKHALDYATKLKWPVFPVSKDKTPITPHGFRDATTDLEQIRRWWTDHPEAGIGVPTGNRSGMFVVDVDGEAGAAALEMILDREGELPDTWESWTGGGGRHLFFEYPKDLPEGVEIRNSAGRLAECIDVRGEGGYIVAPPSPHSSGQRYRWKIPPDGKQARPPKWLLDLVLAKRPALGREEAPRDPVRYAEAVLRSEVDAVASAAEGTRNETLNAATFNVGRFWSRGWLSRSAIEAALTTAAENAGLSAEEIRKTIASGLNAYHPPPEIDVKTAWWQQLDRDDDGRVYRTDKNLRTVLTKHPDWVGVLGFDERQGKTVYRKRAPTGDPSDEGIEDKHVYRVREWVESKLGWTVPMERMHLAIDAVGDEHRFDPVRVYLEALRWDGSARADAWLECLCGAPPIEYTRAVASKWLISAVARALDPGCKADHLIVLEGKQGKGKSSALAALAGDQWFSDALPTIGTKDSKQHLQGPWVLEIAELDAMKKAEIESIKAFLSARSDRFRPPYGRREVVRPRRCVFAGTTNQDQWSNDSTGARRFWPIPCTEIRVDQIKTSRDQLWAEAVHRYRQGEQWWLTPDEAELATEEQDARFRTDEWEEVLVEYLDRRTHPVTVGDCLKQLDLEPKDWTQSAQNRAAKILRRLGWERTRRRVGGVRRYCYLPPPDDQLVIDNVVSLQSPEDKLAGGTERGQANRE